MPLPQDIRDMLGLPEDVVIEGRAYKAYPLTGDEYLQYVDYSPASVQIDKDGKPIAASTITETSGQFRAQMWILYCTLRRQVKEMERDTFEEFMKEPSSVLVVFSPLIVRSMQLSVAVMEKKN